MRAPASILVIAGGDGRDQAAFEMAAGLASRNAARVTVAAVLKRLPRAFQRLSLVIDSVGLWEMAARERGRYLDTLVRVEGFAPAVRVQTRVLFGKAVEQIAREAARQGADLVIVRGRRWIGYLPAWLRFDLPTRLARSCPCPVWTVKSGSRREWLARGLDCVMAR